MEYESPIDSRTWDAQSFRAFYTETLPVIYGYFLHRCGRKASEVEDLTQDTYMAAVREIRRGARIVAPVPWILGIARHKLMDHYRRQDRTE
jgi:RNA polymerase sigma-70 factor (ECF subfamily)